MYCFARCKENQLKRDITLFVYTLFAFKGPNIGEHEVASDNDSG